MAGEREQPHDTEDVQEFPCSADDCEETTREDSLIRGSYCSVDCFHRDKGRSILTKIKHDHRFCSSCYRVRKEIDYPPREFIAARSKLVGESIIGEETLTPQMSVDSGLVYCECGTVDHDAEDETLRNIDRGASLLNLWSLLHQLSDEGQVPNIPSREPFLNALEREGEIALAVGASVYD